MKIAIVGASRGIGLEFCKQYSSEHQVFAFCRKSTVELDNIGVEKIIEGCEVTDISSLENAVSKAGMDQLDLLVHVSGILSSQTLSDFNVEEIKKQFEVNSIGPILTYKAFEKHLSSGSKFAVLSSRMGSIADNSSGGSYGYRMSKVALNMAAVSLANDLKPKEIAVLVLHPGFVKTEMTKGNGLIDTKESVAGLTQILSEKGLSETGTFWHTNGEQLPW